MTSLENIIETYGYFAVVLGTFFEGETILILAGLAAHRGYLSLPLVMLAAFAGSFLGDQLYFFVGRTHGAALVARRPALAARIASAQSFLRRHHVIFILGFRFLYGLRTVSPLAIGMSDVSPRRYLLLNLFGAAVWSVGLGLLGYSVGRGAELLLGRVKEVEGWLFLGVGVAGLLISAFFYLRRRAGLAAESREQP